MAIEPAGSLPDVSRLASVTKEQWRAFALYLGSIGCNEQNVAALYSISGNVFVGVQPVMRKWHLRQRKAPAAYAMRLLLMQDPVKPDEARLALGEHFEVLLNAGLVLEDGDGSIVFPFDLNVLHHLYILSDLLWRGGDAAMGPSSATCWLCRASVPERPVNSVLDLGCGAGSIGLWLAPRARRVVAVDINPRALIMAKVNAALNGVENIEVREGDLFAPVLDERFDIIASQPPYVARLPGSAPTAFLHGGAQGDELPLRVLTEAPAFITPAGRVLVISSWPGRANDAVEDRVSRAVGPGAWRVLNLMLPTARLDDFSIATAAGEHPGLGPKFEEAAWRWRAHLESMGLTGLPMGIHIVERADSGPGWRMSRAIPEASTDRISGPRIEQIIRSYTLAHAGVEEIKSARLRMPEGATLTPSAGSTKGEISATFPPEALLYSMKLGRPAAYLTSKIDGAESVGAAIQTVMAETRAPEAQVIEGVRAALSKGLLEVA